MANEALREVLQFTLTRKRELSKAEEIDADLYDQYTGVEDLVKQELAHRSGRGVKPPEASTEPAKPAIESDDDPYGKYGKGVKR